MIEYDLRTIDADGEVIDVLTFDKKAQAMNEIDRCKTFDGVVAVAVEKHDTGASRGVSYSEYDEVAVWGCATALAAWRGE